jgi:hypothetical protein
MKWGTLIGLRRKDGHWNLWFPADLPTSQPGYLDSTS